MQESQRVDDAVEALQRGKALGNLRFMGEINLDWFDCGGIEPGLAFVVGVVDGLNAGISGISFRQRLANGAAGDKYRLFVGFHCLSVRPAGGIGSV